MGVEVWIAIVSAVLGGGGLVGLVGSLIMLPKLRAEARNLDAAARKSDTEARKINVESDGQLVDRLWAEIERLDHNQTDLRGELRETAKTAAVEKAALEKENRRLRARVGELENRIKAMEQVLSDVFNVEPNTPEFRNLLKRIDDAEAKMKRRGNGGGK